MNFARTFVAVLLAQIVLIMFCVGGLALIGLVSQMGGSSDDVQKGSWLVVDIYGEILPYDPPESISSALFGKDDETLQRILTNLEKASVDERVAGVLLKVSAQNTLGRAGVQEIREAVKKVRSAGKPVYAWSDDLDRRSLFLASACDSIYLAPPAQLGFVGMGFIREFYKGTLDKLAVNPNVHKIKDYKTAAEPFTRKDMSSESREMAGWLLEEFWDMVLGAISEERGISMEELEKHMEWAEFSAQEARDAKFVDGVLYWDELLDLLTEDGDDHLRVVTQKAYDNISRKSVGIDGDGRVAVVHAWGMIGGRRSKTNPAYGVMMGHETVVKQLREVGNDDKIDAVVLRVDSPGGESLASQIIANEVARLREKKPVVVSMGDVAASGGYAIAYKATRVVADPLTITGSIGSISAKFNTRGMYEKIGLTFDWVTKGPNSLMWSPITDFTREQRARFEDAHNKSFQRWLEDIADERNMSVEELTELAQGRVWTGRQARDNGLVDELGGLDRAIEVAKEEAGIAASEGVQLTHYPRKKGLYAVLTGDGGPWGVARSIVLRLMRDEVTETMRIMTESDMRLWAGDVIE